MNKNSCHTPESIEKMRANRKGKACGDNNSMANPIHREKARLGVQAVWDSRDAPYKHKDWLVDQYVNQKKTTIQIAKELNVNYVTIWNWLCKFGIDSRGNCPEHHEYKDFNWLYDQYTVQGKSADLIGSELNVSQAVISNWVRRHGIPSHVNADWIGGDKSPMRRPEIVAKVSGENSCHWKGGLSFEPYCEKWTESLRKRIRAFFDYKCLTCGKSTEDNEQNLCCHHVHYNKQTCCDESVPMFAALCRSCHTKTGNDRESWMYMISYIIQEVYDGKSYYTKEEWKKVRSSLC